MPKTTNQIFGKSAIFFSVSDEISTNFLLNSIGTNSVYGAGVEVTIPDFRSFGEAGPPSAGNRLTFNKLRVGKNSPAHPISVARGMMER